MECGEVISVTLGLVRIGDATKQVDLPPGVKVGDEVIVRGRMVEKKETFAMRAAPERKSWS